MKTLLLALTVAATGYQATPLPRVWRTLPSRLEFGQWSVQASINGKEPVWLLLDTGSDNTSLNRAYASSLGLAKAQPANVPQAQMSLWPCSIVVGDLSFRIPSPEVWRLPEGDSDAQPLLKGVIGWELLSRCVFKFDPDRATIEVMDADEFDPPQDAQAVDIDLKSLQLSCRIECKTRGESSRSFRACMDTGFFGTMVMLKDAPEAVSRSEIAYTLPAWDEIRIGGTILRNLPVVASEQMRQPNPDNDIPILGHAALSRFRMTIDYKHLRMYLEPRVGFESPLVQTLGCRFDCTAELRLDSGDYPQMTAPRLVVASVQQGSVAEALGFKDRDGVLRVGPVEASRITPRMLLQYLSVCDPGGVPVVVKRASGETATIRVKNIWKAP